jgi:hypothetical protein
MLIADTCMYYMQACSSYFHVAMAVHCLAVLQRQCCMDAGLVACLPDIRLVQVRRLEQVVKSSINLHGRTTHMRLVRRDTPSHVLTSRHAEVATVQMLQIIIL